MKNQITINVHSFVDLITNSSSEIFVEASASTITAIKKMLTNVLAAGGSTKTADDLFTFDLGYEVTDTKDYDTVYVSKAEFKKIEKAWEEYEESKYSEDDETEGMSDVEKDERDAAKTPRYEPRYDESEFHNTRIVVTVKDEASKEAKAAAKTLSDLTGLFNLEATMN